jgi:outer membrane lipopolysaccharide assembly protein LptE/RlpB
MQKKLQKKIILIIAAGMFILHSGCGFYSHTGASIPPDAKTFSVGYIANTASIVSPTLSQTFTEKLKTKILNETQLKLTTGESDFLFSGKIIDYKTAPVAVQSSGVNAVNQLTISISITFEDKLDEKKNYTETFTGFANYSATQNLSSVETDLIIQVSDIIIQNIFNKTFVNW